MTSDQCLKYCFAFNGKEMDNSIKGSGNSYDFGARIYDSRLGRWMSVDPMASLQPSWSTYKAFLDNPIFFVDPEGETEKKY
jgi:RHS repeat-associated protein